MSCCEYKAFVDGWSSFIIVSLFHHQNFFLFRCVAFICCNVALPFSLFFLLRLVRLLNCAFLLKSTKELYLSFFFPFFSYLFPKSVTSSPLTYPTMCFYRPLPTLFIVPSISALSEVPLPVDYSVYPVPSSNSFLFISLSKYNHVELFRIHNNINLPFCLLPQIYI